MPVLAALSLAMTLHSTPADWKRWGLETIDQIRRELYLSQQKLYAEDDSKKQVAFNWPAGVMWSALNAAARADASYKPHLREFAEAMRGYWRPEGGFDVLPHMKKSDRYYDDNAWIALDLIETSQILSDDKYLEWAEKTVAFILTGEDEKLGGGLYWRENEKVSKNTCANAPTAVACLELFRATGKKEHLENGRRVYAWTRSRLQDPETGLFWDHIDLAGKVDKTTWSYNTALMMRASRLLKSIDPVSEVGPDLVKPATKRWLQPDHGVIKDDMAFAHLLFEAMLAENAENLDVYLVGLHERARDSRGHYGHRWNDVASSPRPHFRLIDQASAARAYLMGYLASRKSQE